MSRLGATIAIGAGAGAIAFVLLWGGWHLWVDHQDLHSVLAWAREIQLQQQRLISQQEEQRRLEDARQRAQMPPEQPRP